MGEYLPDRLADESITFMRQSQEKQKPFFIALFNYTVHWPMEAPARLIDKYKERPLKGYRDHRYAAMIEALDAAMGKIFDALDEMKLAEDTLVIFTSDNGPFGGVGDARPLRGDKGHLYEGGIRVPFIARWPGQIDAGVICNEPVISTDLHPTFLAAAGLVPKPEAKLDGRSLIGLLRNQTPLGREAVYWHYPNYAWHRGNRLGSAVRMGSYKLIERFDDGSLELYNLKSDLGEKKNLAGSEPDRARRMLHHLRAWRKEVDAAMPTRRKK